MRSVYAVSFAFPPGANPDHVLDTAGSWVCRGRAANEVRTSWAVGRRSYPIPLKDQTLDVEVFESDEGRLWRASWRHPHSDDRGLHLVSDVEVGVIGESVTMSLVIRAVWAQPKVAPPRFEMRAPRLARTVVKKYDVRDGQHRLTAKPQVLDAAGVSSFVDDLLLDPARTRPVVFVADDSYLMGPNTDPAELAAELAGLAHVYTSLYGRPAWELGRRLDRLGCGDGGIRIWWPGLKLSGNPYRHLLLSGHALRSWQGPEPSAFLFRRVSTAAAMNGVPESHTRLRRAGRLAQAADATDDEARKLLAYALEYNEELAADLKAARAERDEFELDREELAEQLREAQDETEQIRQNFAEVTAALPGVQPGVQHGRGGSDEGAGEPGNVREAVELAVPQCPHLAFADRAFESAGESPFEVPGDILDALLKLERLASSWARPGGIGGADLGQKATRLGLNWKADVSDMAKNKHERLYTFMWDGGKRTMGPHIRLGSGSGAGRIARIYLDRFEPDDPSERKLIVAHVGKKLPDKTT